MCVCVLCFGRGLRFTCAEVAELASIVDGLWQLAARYLTKILAHTHTHIHTRAHIEDVGS